jgi:hypothetical protein
VGFGVAVGIAIATFVAAGMGDITADIGHARRMNRKKQHRITFIV